MTNEKVVGASSLPTVDRGTDARAKMSRKRFLAFIMTGIMIVSAVSMIAPGMLGNNDQDDGNDQPAGTANFASGTSRTSIIKMDHMFEMYLKNGGSLTAGTPNGAGWGGLLNSTKAYHGGNDQANHPAKEAFLGHHNQTLMGVSEWLNTSIGPSYRESFYADQTLRNNYPYMFYLNSAPAGKYDPAIAPGLTTWAPFRMTVNTLYDTALKTGTTNTAGGATGRNVPFLPYWNRSTPASFKGGYVNLSSYGTYVTDDELDLLNLGGVDGHFGNWYYDMPAFVDTSAANDGYFYEWHGTLSLSRNALVTFLNWTPGVHGKTGTGAPDLSHIDEADARTWFKAELATRGMAVRWKAWLEENYSEENAAHNYYGNNVNNGNIYTNYEDTMIAWSSEMGIGLKVDPSTTGYNASGAGFLSIRFYFVGWGPDAGLVRMIEQANICGSIAKMGVNPLFNNRASIINYNEDLYLNCSIREYMGNSSLRYMASYNLINWEDPGSNVWSGGWMFEFGMHNDYVPNFWGPAAQISWPSPFNRYAGLPAALYSDPKDPYILTLPKGAQDYSKTRKWNGPGSTMFGTNASVVGGAPFHRNLTAYEAIVIDLNLLSSPWLAALKTRVGGMTLGMQPYQAAGDTPGAAKTAEFNRWLYWGTLMLGKGCYPQTTILSMYNASTKILNLSGGATGLTMPTVWNTDIWGGNTHQPTTVYIRGQPLIQFDVNPVSSYQVTLQGGPSRMVSTNYWVKVTPLDALGQIPRNLNGKLIVNETIRFTTNNPGTTWPTGLPAPAVGNGTQVTFNNATNPGGSAWTVVRFGTIKANTYVNVTGQWFNWSVGGSAVPSPAPATLNQAIKGSSGSFDVGAIPEFATVLIPIVGVMAMFFIFRTKKRKREE
jgi:hypothetical protein